MYRKHTLNRNIIKVIFCQIREMDIFPKTSFLLIYITIFLTFYDLKSKLNHQNLINNIFLL